MSEETTRPDLSGQRIGFIGLGGPVLARLMGARRLRDQLLWAPLVGALLLAIADQAVQSLPGVLGELLLNAVVSPLNFLLT